MARRFEQRVAVVTGGASGIGLAIVERFAEQGANVALLDRDAASGEAASARIRGAGGVCEFIRADVGSESSVIQAIDEAARRFHAIDHLVNNAGMVLVKGIEECTA